MATRRPIGKILGRFLRGESGSVAFQVGMIASLIVALATVSLDRLANSSRGVQGGRIERL